MTEIRVACVQNTATRDIQANVDWVCARIDEAVVGGAGLVALPETVGLIEPVNERIPAATSSEAKDIGLAAFRARAQFPSEGAALAQSGSPSTLPQRTTTSITSRMSTRQSQLKSA